MKSFFCFLLACVCLACNYPVEWTIMKQKTALAYYLFTRNNLKDLSQGTFYFPFYIIMPLGEARKLNLWSENSTPSFKSLEMLSRLWEECDDSRSQLSFFPYLVAHCSRLLLFFSTHHWKLIGMKFHTANLFLMFMYGKCGVWVTWLSHLLHSCRLDRSCEVGHSNSKADDCDIRALGA